MSGFTQGGSGFLLKNGVLTPLNDPNGAVGTTMALGVNNADEVVGTYTDANGAAHGFTYQNGTYQTVDVTLAGATGTTINGINNQGQIVWFYTDSSNPANIIGFLGTPQSSGGLGGGGAATPELGSGELLATGLLPIGAVLLYRRRRRPRRVTPRQ